jgi:hypothetical protein
MLMISALAAHRPQSKDVAGTQADPYAALLRRNRGDVVAARE